MSQKTYSGKCIIDTSDCDNCNSRGFPCSECAFIHNGIFGPGYSAWHISENTMIFIRIFPDSIQFSNKAKEYPDAKRTMLTWMQHHPIEHVFICTNILSHVQLVRIKPVKAEWGEIILVPFYTEPELEPTITGTK